MLVFVIIFPNVLLFFFFGLGFCFLFLVWHNQIAGFYAGMLRREYVTMDVFNKNFMTDWKKHMTQEEKAKILDLSKCVP